MSTKRQRSGGQALVLVTLALFAMTGIVGLAVDLGWSFFVEKRAQAAADAAALGAVQEAVVRIRAGGGTVTGFTCAASGTGGTQVECSGRISCGSVTATSNLNNGCQYALKNGFSWTNASRQNVSLQSSDITTLAPPTAPGVVNISYWVTARTVQTIPQLFSAIFGNTTGTVSAVATAAIAGSIAPGSFYGMNHKGDCTNSKDGAHCGLDLITGTGQGKTACPGNPNASGGVCAPAGVILASSCNTTQAGVCDDGKAGDGRGAGVEASSLTVMGSSPANGGKVTGDWHDANGNPLTPNYSTNPNTFADPTSSAVQGAGPQPRLQSQTPIGSCGIPGGTIAGGAGTTVPPLQYYAYSKTDGAGRPIPTGAPISITGNVTFGAGGKTCAQLGGYFTAGATQNSQFPTYIFYGGLNQDGNTHFGPGQYVFAGVNSSADGASVFQAGGTIVGDSATGTMFIFTDTGYTAGDTGLPTQIANVPNNGSFPAMYQGSLSFKNADITLSGLIDSHVSGSNLPASMNAYTGIAWWQDRRNSTVGYDKAPGSPGCFGSDCTGDNGSVIYCALASECTNGPAHLAGMLAANHVTPTSPGVTLDPGNVALNMTGVFYQPRGAWLEIHHGTGKGSATSLGGLQVITGALIDDTGDTRLLLNGPTNPIQHFKTTLIQ